MTLEKVQKILATQGLGSRRQIEMWIEAGRVTVNGEKAHLGQRASWQDTFAFDGKRLVLSPIAEKSEVLLYNKPEGELSTRFDPQGRPTVFDKLPPPEKGKWIQVGRLDINTSGLLVFTTDGEYANQLMHPSGGHERVYLARIRGRLNTASQKKLLEGVLLEDGMAAFSSIEQQSGTDKHNTWYRVSVHQGRNRIVRRLFEALDHEVSRLIRIQYGEFVLPKTLKVGQWVLV